MNRTSTRLSVVGVFVLLGACAIALAQHDSRKRAKNSINPQGSLPQEAQPIPVADDWERAIHDIGTRTDDSPQIVRANNENQAEGLPSIEQSSGEAGQDGAENAIYLTSNESNAATLSAAEAPVEAPSDPPAWLQNLPNSNTAPASSLPNRPSVPSTGAAGGQALPSLPGTYAGSGNQLPGIPSTYPPAGGRSPAGNPGSASIGLAGPGTPPPLMGAQSSIQNSLPVTPQQSNASGAYGSGATGMSQTSLPTAPSSRMIVQPNQTQPSYGASGSGASLNAAQGSSRLPQVPNDTRTLPNTTSNSPNMSDTQRPPQRATDLTASSFPSAGYPQAGAPNANYTGNNRQPAPPRGAIPNNQYQPQTAPGAYPRGALPSNSSKSGVGTGRSQNAYGQRVPPVNAEYTGYSTTQNGQAASRSTGARSSGRTVAQLVSNRPGERSLNGSQNPALIVERRSPEEIQVGKKATFILTVRNAGNATAHNVTVVDAVPRGAKFAGAVPSVQPGTDGMLNWNLGEITAGDERTVTLQLIPEVQGELGSTASVNFATQASVRTLAVQPKLEILLEAQPDVLIQDRQELNVTIRNTGTGVARGVRLEADIPELLRHESGDTQLEAVLGDVRPNETRRISLSASAIAAGKAECVVRAVTDDGVQAEQKSVIDVRAPQIVAAIEGPKLRYLERQATFRLAVKNVGTAAGTDLDFVVHLPSGLKFNSANNRGSYDPTTHTVTWGVLELIAGRVAPMELTVLPVELGPQVIKLTAKGDLGVAAEAKTQLNVEGLAELAFTIGQDNGTIEVGASSTYSVQVMNIGNKPDKNVQLLIELPAGTELMDVNAPVEYRVSGQTLQFAALPEMRNKDQYTYRFQLRHNQAGSQIVRAKVTSANWPNAVVKEEGTLVYNDQK